MILFTHPNASKSGPVFLKKFTGEVESSRELPDAVRLLPPTVSGAEQQPEEPGDGRAQR